MATVKALAAALLLASSPVLADAPRVSLLEQRHQEPEPSPLKREQRHRDELEQERSTARVAVAVTGAVCLLMGFLFAKHLDPGR